MDPIAPPPNLPTSGQPMRGAPGATASMVLGILSLCLGWIPFAGLVLGIIALVLAGKAKKIADANPGVYPPGGGGTRTAGFVCGLIGLIFGALFVVYTAFAVWFVTSNPELMDEIQRGIREERERRGR
jgi:hypothetical protein